MNEYALLKDGAFVKFMYRDTLPEVATHKGYAIYPVVREKVDNSTQKYVVSEIVEVVENGNYVLRKVVSDMPQAERDVLIAQLEDNAVATLSNDKSILKALGAVLFELTNEVRVLKGQQPITAAQFKTYVKGKL